MSTTKTIAKIVPGVMSLGLVSESLKLVPTEKELKGKKKAKPKKMIKGFVKVAIGIPLISATAGMVNKLP